MDSKTGEKVLTPSNFEMVREFHQKFDCPTRSTPGFPPQPRIDLRIELIREEFDDELRVAIQNRDLAGVVDALTDMLYVIYGTGHEFGIQLDKCFAEVHRSNMSKLGADGKPLRRDDGKILKGPGFTPPDLRKILQEEVNLPAPTADF